jgi:3-phenylpropionate/trans-cinnamate dioxygenase ferredoxin subunit
VVEWTDVAAVADFPPGTFRKLAVDGVEMAVFNVDGRYFAIEDICSHEAETLSDGPVEGQEIVCPRHAARFSLLTGEALTPPAYEPIATFPVRVEQGRVQVRDNRFD